MKPFPRVALASAAFVVALVVTALSDDVPLGPTDPSAQEQLVVYTLNKARHDPAAYGKSIGLNLSAVAPQPPLAVNLNLTGSARFHAQDMLARNYFEHVSPVTHKAADFWAVQNGYDLFGRGLDYEWTDENNIESIAVGFNTYATYPAALKGLIVDKGINPPAHRIQLLSTSSYFQPFSEIGAGRAAGTQTLGGQRYAAYYHAIHTGYVSTSDRFLTGVVFDDLNVDGAYDAGEGLGGVTVDAGPGGSTVSLSQGGWSIPVAEGDYDVTCAGGPFVGSAVAHVTVSTGNREIDFRSGLPKGAVDFTVSPIPNVSIGASATRGEPPLVVDFTAASDGFETDFAWDFGDGGADAGAAVEHQYDAPGVFVVRLAGTDVGGVGRTLTAVCVDGPAGAGAGTIPPASKALTPTGCKTTRNFVKVGKDSITFTGRMEMPAGWTRGLSSASVVIAGATTDFPLVAGKDKLALPGGSVLSLAYKLPKRGASLGAGVVAKVSVTLKGDLASVLDDLGVRNATEKRTLSDVPFAVVLGDACWTGTAKLAINSKRNVKSTGALAKP